MAVADVNVGEANMPLFLKDTAGSLYPQDILSWGLLIEPHPTSQALICF